MAQQQPQQAIHKFVLGNKELEGKTVEFQYDKGWYSITDIVGEERNVIYKSRNAQEAYMKWNVYIGRKKERTASGRNSDAEHGNRAEGNRAYDARDRRNRDSRASYARFPSARFPCSASLFRPDAVRSFLRPIYTFHFI